MKKMLSFAVLVFLAVGTIVSAAVHTEEVTYSAGGTNMKGYLAYDDAAKAKRPGVLVVHEWWGLNDYARSRARMLAESGYVALALDMYGDGKQTTHADEAMKFYTEVMSNMDALKARFDAAVQVLKKNPHVDPDRVAAIGYCFGGTVVLNMAASGEDLDGVASFHGGLSIKTPPQPGTVKAKIRVYTGAEDPFVPPTDVAAFKKMMDDAKADYKVTSYPGAKHSFTNKDADTLGKAEKMPLEYNADADHKSWADMLQFFKQIFP